MMRPRREIGSENREPQQREPDQRQHERPHDSERPREHRLRSKLVDQRQEPPREHARRAECHENDEELHGVAEHEDVLQQPLVDRRTDLGKPLRVEEFRHGRELRFRYFDGV